MSYTLTIWRLDRLDEIAVAWKSFMSIAFGATESNCYASAKRSPTDVTKGYGSKQGGYSLPPGDCKASVAMIDPVASFVKQGIEPFATIFVVCGTRIAKWCFTGRGFMVCRSFV
jgi:hypothetical protein